jgi:hypothetical protein
MEWFDIILNNGHGTIESPRYLLSVIKTVYCTGDKAIEVCEKLNVNLHGERITWTSWEEPFYAYRLSETKNPHQ